MSRHRWNAPPEDNSCQLAVILQSASDTNYHWGDRCLPRTAFSCSICGRPLMSNRWFFRKRSPACMPAPVSTMERRRSSSERPGPGSGSSAGAAGSASAPVAPSVELVALASGPTFNVYSHCVAGSAPAVTPSIRVSGSMSRIQSARSSTASYCPALGGTVFAGDVPPLHRRSFLGPDGTRIVQPADSNDNIAQLIPRWDRFQGVQITAPSTSPQSHDLLFIYFYGHYYFYTPDFLSF